jgi:serine phosphatase RsbU (regulator of sigma subunit)
MRELLRRPTWSYALYGALFGCAFPVISTVFDVFVQGVPITWATLLQAQRDQPLHWIIDSAPLFLGLFASLAGRKQEIVQEINAGLEQTIEVRTLELREQNVQLASTQKELERSINRIQQSISYAQRIQQAILLDIRTLQTEFPDSAIIYRPKDVVSGDFPWCVKTKDGILMAAVDCTGHGVPGAFMSLVGYFILNGIVREKGITDPGLILNELHDRVSLALDQHNQRMVQDGMELLLLHIDRDNNVVEYASAGGIMYHVSANGLTEHRGDSLNIGGRRPKKWPGSYTTHRFNYSKGDLIALFSDGIPDQDAPNHGPKFGYDRIKDLFATNGDRPLSTVWAALGRDIDTHMAGTEQVDDMLLMAARL